MKNSIKIILINVVILFFLFSLFEWGLRLFWKMSTLEGVLYRTSKNRNLRYELEPNASAGYVTINSDGFRDKNYPLLKSDGSFRIIVLGDSETFAKALPLKDTMPKVLEQKLNERCGAKNFEVLNMGVEGYNTIQEEEFLKYKGLKYKPDLVILYYCFNDPDYPEYYFKKNFWNRNFLVFRYIQYRIKKGLVRRDRKLKGIISEEDNFRYLYAGESWAYTEEAILELAKLAQKESFKFVLVVNPEASSKVFNFRDKYPYWYINEKLASLKKYGIKVIDPTYFFKERNYNPLSLVVSNKDRHKNKKGNSVVASYLCRELFDKGLVRCD